jgi:hypothetical protein
MTENKTFAIVGEYGFGPIVSTSDYYNWSVFDIHSENIWGYISGFYFQNDDCGYISSCDWTTGHGFFLQISKTIDAGETWEETPLSVRGFSGDISLKSNFSFSEDNEFGYFLSEQLLLRTPYTGDFHVDVGLDNIKSETQLVINRQGNDLRISSLSKTIASIEIISVTGTKLLQKRNNQAKEFSVDIAGLPVGVYLVHAVYTDKTSNISKWIKN